MLNRGTELQGHTKHLLAVTNGANKDLRLTFDNNVQKTMTLPEDKTPGDLAFDFPILSASLKINVVSAYSSKKNGFASIRIWMAGKENHFKTSFCA